MARKLVVCCDGTWNKPRSSTNISRTYGFLRAQIGMPAEVDRGSGAVSCSGSLPDGSAVVLYYDQGVGTTFWTQLAGGAVGAGLSRNVRGAYHFLSNTYAPGDEIYLFGFSRGAYTVRSLCGFIQATGGLLQQADEDTIRRAYLKLYATPDRVVARPVEWSIGEAIADLRRKIGLGAERNLAEAPCDADTPIHFVGVYDTVGALGIPLPATARINEAVVGFHDTGLCRNVRHAVHALAADEQRGPYEPTLWRLKNTGDALLPGQTCLQVWFPGVHSDVGGGYPDQGIGNITLDFMLRRAAEAGLFGHPDADPLPPLRIEPLPAQHDSIDAFWRRVYGIAERLKAPRLIGPVARRAGGDTSTVVAGREMLHPSLVDRLDQPVNVLREGRGGSLDRAPYRPARLDWSAEEVRRGSSGLQVFQERAALRLPTNQEATIDGRRCRILDRSAFGVRIGLDRPLSARSLVSVDGVSGEVIWASTGTAGIRLQAAEASAAAE